MNKFMESVIYYLLLTRGKFLFWYGNAFRFFIDTSSLSVMFDGKTPISFYWRYLIIKSLQSCINQMTRFRNYLDIKAKKIQLVKDRVEGDKPFILEAKADDVVTISNIINHVDTKGELDNDGHGPILMKFELVNPGGESICLKRIIAKYQDFNNYHNHTLNNIISFNKIVVLPDCKLKIVKMEKGKRVTSEFNYVDIQDSHISNLMNLSTKTCTGSHI
jgi:hypothetical protein